MSCNAAVKMKGIMASRELTQVQLAQAVGISQPYLSQLLSGEKSPSLDVAIRLARELGLSLDELYADEDEPGGGHER